MRIVHLRVNISIPNKEMNFKTDNKNAIKILVHYIGIGFILFVVGFVALSFFTAYLRCG